MSKRVAVVIAEDPEKSPRPVEALRIALGLCSGDHETSVVLLGRAPTLISEHIDDVMDVDILEKYRPSLAQLSVPFLLESHSAVEDVLPEFSVVKKTAQEIRSFLQSVDRTLVFA